MADIRFDKVFGVPVEQAAAILQQLSRGNGGTGGSPARILHCEYCGVATEKRSGTCDHCGAPLNPGKE